MSKYHNVKTLVFGILFDSQREANRYLFLRSQQEEGKIEDLRTQVKFPIIINGVKICDYVADFTYTDQTGATIIDDAKGYKTREYAMKKKLVRACYGFDIRES